MPRTVTRVKDAFFLDGRGGVSFPSNSSQSAGSATIIFPAGSKSRTGLHWHETHTEYLSVIQGVALITLGEKTARFRPEDGIIVIPRYTKHEYTRADTETLESSEDGQDVDLLVKEWTDPSDGKKERFFRNILGVIEDRDTGIRANISTLLQLFVIFNGHDNYPVFLRLPNLGGVGRTVEMIVTHVALFVASILGRLAGFRVEYPEYTPEN